MVKRKRLMGVLAMLALPPGAEAQDAHSFPAWSPDGRRIACVRESGQGKSLVLIDLETARTTQVLGPGIHDGFFTSWHPSGEWLGFRSLKDGNAEAYKVRLDGSRLTRLTDHEAEDGVPYWSADGGRFAFRSDREGEGDVYVQAVDGPLDKLTSHPARDGVPFWNHTSGAIGFHSTRHGNWDLFVVDPATKVVRPLLVDPADDYLASWSPDGKLVAFISNRDTPAGEETRKVHVLDVRTGQTRALVDVGEANFLPTWSPDSSRAAVHRPVDGVMQVFTVSADGTDLVQVTGLGRLAGERTGHAR